MNWLKRIFNKTNKLSDMKRYWLFSYDDCYPRGGISDFTKDFKTIKSAKNYFKNGDKIGCNIFDSKNNVVVYDSKLLDMYEIHGFGNIEDEDDEIKEQLLNSVTDSHLKNLYPIDLWDDVKYMT